MGAKLENGTISLQKSHMSEYSEQKIVIQWWRDTYPQYEKAIRLSLNGLNLGSGVRAAKIINQMKAQGYVKGESDLFIAVPQNHIGGFCGLFIEMKDFDKKPTDDQLAYLEYQLSMGYATCWCEGAEAAIKVISEYMVSMGSK